MIGSSSCVRMLARGFVGPIRASDVDSRAFHLAIVLRLTPYRLARAMFFSSLSWIARRTLGVVVARECVCGCAARSCFRATPHLLRIAPQHHHPPKALMRFVRRGANHRAYGSVPRRFDRVRLGHPPTPKARRANMQLWNPHPVTLVMYRRVHAPNARRYEMAIHRLLKPYRVHGEWFSAPLPVIRKAAEVAARQSLTSTAMEKFSALCAKHPGRDHPVSTVKAVTVATYLFDAPDLEE